MVAIGISYTLMVLVKDLNSDASTSSWELRLPFFLFAIITTPTTQEEVKEVVNMITLITVWFIIKLVMALMILAVVAYATVGYQKVEELRQKKERDKLKSNHH